jgi:hypothetical protein
MRWKVDGTVSESWQTSLIAVLNLYVLLLELIFVSRVVF